MTTEQIIKALECCFINQNCNGCPMYNGITTQKGCLEVACKNALALIKEQQAQIKVLEADRNNYKEWYVQAVGEIKEFQAHNENLKKENKYLRERLAEEMEHKEDMEGE